MTPLVDIDTARAFLSSVVPEWEWLLAQVENEGGYVRFPRQLTQMIANLRIESYPRLYENEAAIGAVACRAVVGDAELEEFNATVTSATPQERGRMLQDLLDEFSALEGGFSIPKTPKEEAAARAAFLALPLEEQQTQVKLWQSLMMAFLASFHQQLSVAVHGEKLSALVAQAKAGSTTAFAKAVQIDKRTLTAIPAFAERWEIAGMQGDTALLEEVGRRLAAPPYRGRIRHKSLWLTFAALESFGLLDTFKHDDLLDFCDGVGLGRFRNRIDDVKNLSKRLAEYRRFQLRGLILESTP